MTFGAVCDNPVTTQDLNLHKAFVVIRCHSLAFIVIRVIRVSPLDFLCFRRERDSKPLVLPNKTIHTRTHGNAQTKSKYNQQKRYLHARARTHTHKHTQPLSPLRLSYTQFAHPVLL